MLPIGFGIEKLIFFGLSVLESATPDPGIGIGIESEKPGIACSWFNKQKKE